VVLHPAADAELTEAVAYYTAIDPALGQRFYLEMERLIGDICAHPKTFRQFDPPARRHFSPRFPYGIIYLEQDDRLWIVAVMQMKRQPGYWKSRVE
jgi:plasmid stabilization system protein ParE